MKNDTEKSHHYAKMDIAETRCYVCYYGNSELKGLRSPGVLFVVLVLLGWSGLK